MDFGSLIKPGMGVVIKAFCSGCYNLATYNFGWVVSGWLAANKEGVVFVPYFASGLIYGAPKSYGLAFYYFDAFWNKILEGDIETYFFS